MLRRVSGGSGEVLSAQHPFGRYKREEKKEVRKADVKADVKEGRVLKQLKEAWGRFEGGNIDKIYSRTLDLIKNIAYSSKDVERFSIALSEFQDEMDFSYKIGEFLSALINNGQDSDYVIHTRHLSSPINFLGYQNTKNIIVEGNVGSSVGKEMITGRIEVNGDVGVFTGNGMKNGEIIINGNASDWAGVRMQGGEIHLNGSYEHISDSIDGGRIYHKGVLIYPKENGEKK